ncbi:YhbY family RNA-binding protein [bacterium]|nr:YhbY family RNA-binding protein [bacterium]
MNLTGKQKAYLKKLVHATKPLVMIGGKGVSEQVIKAIDEELTLKELIKIKFSDFKEQKKEIFPQIAEQVDAIAIDLIGNIGILYRQNSDPDKQKINIPN